MEKVRRVRCTTHCPCCGSHFSSTAAFDAHRKGPIGERVCIEPADLVTRDGRPVLAAKSEEGVCMIYGPGRVGVPVWAMAASLESRGFEQVRAA